MVATVEPRSKTVPSLARFITKEAIALLLNIKPEDIYRIDCWFYVIHVVGKGVSTFVSYADIPPIVGVDLPTLKELLRWRKRWKKNKYKAPDFWVEFYAQNFQQIFTCKDLYAWGELLHKIQFGLSETAGQYLRSLYNQAKESCLQTL